MKKALSTRQNILEKAFDIIYTKSYQTTSIDEIIATTKVTKGAFYYHFKTKDEMGIAIINEIVKPTMEEAYIAPLRNVANPIEQIYAMITSLLLETPYLKPAYGCPAGNLIQEMSPWHTEFSKALNELVLEWKTAIENCLQKEIENGTIAKTTNPKQVAQFVISSYWGTRNLAKIATSTNCYRDYLNELKRYLNNLK
ncbi:TetR/AcrR family transcriptional regulator [Flavicella sediminum]|uniref:TetR/AcrR family transcriptional regulator n=1 Tax=Flavicella sediminum TaxID=2585141 RepID=UPI00111F77B8|nr:TetR/AcrR family transcriptional regulator [Flavicella sediminum]